MIVVKSLLDYLYQDCIIINRNGVIMENMLDFYEKLVNMVKSINGDVYLVGGAIRDKLIGNVEPKDYDFVVTHIDLDDLTKLLKSTFPYGSINEVGKSFGIIKLRIEDDEFDFAIPRQDVDRNNVTYNKDINIVEDLDRRDFVINAGAWNLNTEFKNQNIISPNGYNVVDDINNKIIRTVGNPLDRFTEDSLRMIRAIQISSRLGFDISQETKDAIQKLAPKLKSVSGERIFEELKKAWTKGKADSKVLVNLLDKLTIGKTLFGNTFNPIPATLSNLKGEDKVIGMFVAFFLRGGDFNIMKPDANCIKVLELAKNIHSSTQSPHTFIGNLKPQLPILLNVFQDIGNARMVDKVQDMMRLPMTSKELAIKGEEIISILQIVSPKDSRKIGIVQKLMLEAIWDGSLENKREQLIKFCEDYKKCMTTRS